MQDTLLSPFWYRVAQLHPRLRPHVSVRMQTTRGQAWYVLYNQATARHHRVNAQAYELIGRLDGRHSVDEVWQVLLERLGDDAPTQHDVIRILGQMTDAGLIQAEVVPDLMQLIRTEGQRNQREKRTRLNPLSFRLGLFNPSWLLERAAPLCRAVWSPWVQWPWLLLVLVAAWSVGVELDQVMAYGQTHFLTPGYLAAAWVIYPLMKALHEAGHALALRRYGCEVPEVGVNFFLFVPMPFVDASASNSLVNRWQRAHISAAGIWVELGLASVAALLWLSLEEGWARQVAFVVMSLGGLSSLLFNGNPLMRLDGYYVLCDTVDLPNLGGRSAQTFSRGARSLLQRVAAVPPSGDDAGPVPVDALERWALRLYAPASWFYRVGVFGLIVYWAADKAALLGLAVLLWSVWTLAISPLGQWWQGLQAQAPGLGARGRLWGLGALGTLVVTVALTWLPLPSSMVVEGAVWLPEDAQVRASTDGEVETVWVRSQRTVEAGEPLITLRAPAMETRREVLRAQVAQAEAEYNVAWGSDPLRMRNALEALERDRAALAQLERELADNVLKAGVAGQFVLPREEDLEGFPVKRGQLLAYVLGPQPAVVRVLVPQRDIDELRSRLRTVTVMLDEEPGRVRAARWSREVPAAADRLPLDAMADRNGGRVLTDPARPDELHPLEPSFVVDVVLDEPLPRSGGLARVRLELAPRSLMDTLVQRARQLFLRHFADLQP